MKKDLLPPPLVAWTLRLALATAFLSAVADRFGLWGPPGGKDIAWGAWQPFVDYTGVLLVALPKALIPAAAIMATVAEVVLGLWLLTGWKSRWAALGSTALLLSFAIAMVLSLGVKAPLNYSVFSAMAAAMALATLSES
ncbi:DoxX family protein [Luteolibacter luteus]|uniref:DoxX family protein n=1 Tax=Luteolibacter luteus TaxID=2728835 RepID=A0A858RQK7_9BACT|nr:DoxX family protein [Luteolibacter luteus]QJE98668.1 DoxX family protein [Luteolibacter luteus]